MLAYMWHKWSTDQAIPWCPKPYCKVLIGLAEIPHINAWPGPMVVTLLYLRHHVHVVCCCKGTTRADQEILRQKSNMENKTHFHTQGQKVKQTRDLKLRAAFSRLLTKHQVSKYIHCLRDPFKDQSKQKSSYTLNAGNSKWIQQSGLLGSKCAPRRAWRNLHIVNSCDSHYRHPIQHETKKRLLH